MATPAWEPIFHYLGYMPTEPGVNTFQVGSFPSAPIEIQVYSYISVQGLDPKFERGYYEVYTQSTDGSKKFACYMNVANVNDTVLNSDNFWLPYGDGIDTNVYVQLISAEGSTGMNPKKPRRKNVKGLLKDFVNQRRTDDDEVHGELYVTGYRTRT